MASFPRSTTLLSATVHARSANKYSNHTASSVPAGTLLFYWVLNRKQKIIVDFYTIFRTFYAFEMLKWTADVVVMHKTYTFVQ